MFIEVAENDWIHPRAVDRVRVTNRTSMGAVVTPFVQLTLSCGSRINLPSRITLEAVLETLEYYNEDPDPENQYSKTPPRPLTGEG